MAPSPPKMANVFTPNLGPWWYPKPPKTAPGSCLGRSWGFLGKFKEAPGGVLGAIWAFWEDFERLWRRLGAVLGLSWGLPGRLWEASGPRSGRQTSLGSVCRRSVIDFERNLLDLRKLEQALRYYKCNSCGASSNNGTKRHPITFLPIIWVHIGTNLSLIHI